MRSRRIGTIKGLLFHLFLNPFGGQEDRQPFRHIAMLLEKFFDDCAISSYQLSLPIDSVSACCYFTYLKEASATLGAIRTAFNAMKWAHSFVPGLNKFNDPLDENISNRVFESALRSIKPGRNIKAPLTTDLLKSFIDSLADSPSLKQLRDATIVSLAHNLLLRHDEISHLSCAHFEENVNHFKI